MLCVIVSEINDIFQFWWPLSLTLPSTDIHGHTLVQAAFFICMNYKILLSNTLSILNDFCFLIVNENKINRLYWFLFLNSKWNEIDLKLIELFYLHKHFFMSKWTLVNSNILLSNNSSAHWPFISISYLYKLCKILVTNIDQFNKCVLFLTHFIDIHNLICFLLQYQAVRNTPKVIVPFV